MTSLPTAMRASMASAKWATYPRGVTLNSSHCRGSASDGTTNMFFGRLADGDVVALPDQPLLDDAPALDDADAQDLGLGHPAGATRHALLLTWPLCGHGVS